MKFAVLIVDDSLTVRMDLAEAFEAAGFDSLPAGTLAEARRALTQDPVALVVLDVLLPDGDGVDFLSELRSSEATATLPVVMLSSESEIKDRIRGLTTGADEYVGKPYDTNYLVAKARELLRARRGSVGDQPTVLIVDDSVTFREALAAALTADGYRVSMAASGEEGLRFLADRRPDAIVVDGVLPEIDGATLIRRVRLDAALRGIPCLLLTASHERGAELRALDAGADAFVHKDDDISVVLAKLKAAMRGATATRPGGEIASLLGPHKILAVDDSPTYLNELSQALRGEGYDVVSARSGEEALELLAVQPVACILLDLVMPGIGGTETCRRIKQAPLVRDTPLIMLTAREDRAAMLDGFGAGADDYIAKSSEFEVLKARLRAQIRRKQFEDENRRIREELLSRELEAERERSARQIAETRAAMVEELELQVDERTRQLQATIVDRGHAERMASLGMLSASIAHEINNPLSVVTGNLELVALSLNALASDPVFNVTTGGAGDGIAAQMLARLSMTEAPLHDALEASERVREIVRDLRIFSRSDGEDSTAAVDVHKVLESSIRMASNEIRHRAELVKEFGNVERVQANESRLGQVFLNLIVNAAQAIPEGHTANNLIEVSTTMQGQEQVVISVRDTGAGIPVDKLDRIFDPFFTTKPAGQGTGLGLAICHRIVVELGGDIVVESELGKGTTFRVVLPAAPKRAEPKGAEVTSLNPPSRRRGRVLIVDDEPALGKTIERILSPEHDVTVVTSAALALLKIDAGERFDALVSDLMMPEMTGMELYERLLRSVPDQAARMSFMTGGAFSPQAAEFLAKDSIRSIEKPFKGDGLREFLWTVLK